jgi:hypothetical protein
VVQKCFSCGGSYTVADGRFCSARCREWFDGGNPPYDPNYVRRVTDAPLSAWRVVAGPPGIEIGSNPWAGIIAASDRIRAKRAAKQEDGLPRESAKILDQDLRHFCRYERCRCKLPALEPFERAFCSNGCVKSFYRFHCVVCQNPMERKTESQRVCGRRKCRQILRSRCRPPWIGQILGSCDNAKREMDLTPRIAESPLRNPINTGIQKRGLDWARSVNSARLVAPRWALDQECPGDAPSALFRRAGRR